MKRWQPGRLTMATPYIDRCDHCDLLLLTSTFVYLHSTDGGTDASALLINSIIP